MTDTDTAFKSEGEDDVGSLRSESHSVDSQTVAPLENLYMVQTNPDYLPDVDLVKEKTNFSSAYTDPEQRPPLFKTPMMEYVTVIMCMFGPGASALAGSAYQVLLTTTSKDFNVNGGKLTWSVSSVILANGSCLLLMGGIADAFGRKRAIMIGFTCYATFALIGGFMNNFVLLCLFRAFQGAGVACSTPAAAGFLGSAYKDSRRKNLVMSILGMGAPVGGAAGYIVGGVCVVALSWRATQFFFAIVYGCMVVLVYFFMPNDRPNLDMQRAKEIFKKMDYGGALLSLTAFVFICFSMTQVDSLEKGWRTPYIIALIVVGICLIGVFVCYELYITSNPLMPMKLFRSMNFCLCMIIASFSWMTFFGVLNYNAVMYFEKIRGYSEIITACCFLTQPITGILVNVFAGFTMHLIPGRILILIGSLGFLTACIIWGTMGADRNYFLGPFWALMFSVIGADLVYNISNRTTLSSLPRELQSRGAGTFNTIIQLSSSISLGFCSLILKARYPAYGTPQENDNLAALYDATRYTYYYGMALNGTAVLLTFFLRIGTFKPKSEAEKQVANGDLEENHRTESDAVERDERDSERIEPLVQ